MIGEFEKWLSSRQREIHHIASLLSQEVSKEPEALISDVTEIEAWYGRANEIFSEAEAWLEHGKRFFLPSRGESTEGERKVVMEDSVADIRKLRNTLEGYVDGIKQRVSLAQSILRYQSQFVERPQTIRK